MLCRVPNKSYRRRRKITLLQHYYYIFAGGDLQRNRGTKGRLIRLRPTKGLLSCWCNTGVGGPGIDKAPGPLC
jgi:hypothetical protein